MSSLNQLNFKLNEIPLNDLSDSIKVFGIDGSTFKKILKYTGYSSRTLYILLPIVISIVAAVIKDSSEKTKVVGPLEISTSIVLGIYLIYMIFVLHAANINGLSWKTPLFLSTVASIIYLCVQFTQMVMLVVRDYDGKKFPLADKILGMAKCIIMFVILIFALLATYNAPKITFKLIMLIAGALAGLGISIYSEIKIFR